MFLGVYSESILPFMEYFFFSRKLCFLWSPSLLLISESISIDTSGKPTVEFFLKTVFLESGEPTVEFLPLE